MGLSPLFKRKPGTLAGVKSIYFSGYALVRFICVPEADYRLF